MTTGGGRARTGTVLYDGECGLCSRWVPRWKAALDRAGFDIAELQSPRFAGLIDRAAPDSWDLTLALADGGTIRGADAYRYVLRRIWWAKPLYLFSIAPGFGRLFDWGYATVARNRYCLSRAVTGAGSTAAHRRRHPAAEPPRDRS